MRIELPPRPSPEQLIILQRPLRPVEIIKGAAGSGKTLTALYKLVFATGYMATYKSCINILILSYNRTLKGYIEAMLQNSRFPILPRSTQIHLTVGTFARWAMNACNISRLNICSALEFINMNYAQLPLSSDYSPDFIAEEMSYILKRFPHNNLNSYIDARRHGRGANPAVDSNARAILVNEYISRYTEWKNIHSRQDWEDVAWHANTVSHLSYDIIVVDEGQDFTANQYRAIVNSLAEDSSLICVIDTAQKIYLNGFTWMECGIDARRHTPVTLSANFRNTQEIASLAAEILSNVTIDEDGVLPVRHYTMRTGGLPVLLRGNFSHQMDYIIDRIRCHLAAGESCAVLLRSSNWDSEVKRRIRLAGFEFASITCEDSWPEENINLVISTMHSAKGLEFDHVFMPGINEQLFPQYSDSAQEHEHRDRRLLAMAIGRARHTVTLGEKPGEESHYFNAIDIGTLQRISV
ncbi:3'-5' exonuclease [Desulfovibrio sp. 86]|uniref:DNA 3'-5' helicase n=1 Tax=uncultured Desulfovibrio sp. TaxID=167968 RepID=A0A212L780_9BACT|nr:3'-5' exonuclease [Desulfovibrio sp. 86]SCM73179.1 putative Superfamily I DNA and RNA helicase-like protein [uncultured Desulfovibrio sp.]VZH34003.1 DNA helicase [Desulfovibrio sp. 86]